jgi:eukaryotic-like serine/threonine-protein kinase
LLAIAIGIGMRDLQTEDLWLLWLDSLGIGLASGLAVAAFFSVSTGFVAGTITDRTRHNEGTWRSRRNGLTVFLIVTSAFAALGSFVASTALIIWGLVIGLILGLRKGGLFFLRHWAVRMALCCYHYAPFRYNAFLSYAKNRAILRSRGGAYDFLHRLLAEYLASAKEKRVLKVRQRADD